MKAVPTIHVVDDDADFRVGVGRLLEAAGYKVIGYESGDQLLDSFDALGPGCLLLDLNMSGLDGLGLQRALTERGCDLPVIFLTGHGDIPSSVRAIKSGAEDFLSKPVAKDALLDAVDRALARQQRASEQNATLKSLDARLATLTAREREVFNLVVRGNMNKQMAHTLNIAERTVKAHRHSIMEKLNARSVANLVSMAERLGLLS
jgi:FixJ family two-component response regulator